MEKIKELSIMVLVWSTVLSIITGFGVIIAVGRGLMTLPDSFLKYLMLPTLVPIIWLLFFFRRNDTELNQLIELEKNNTR